ncbi:MAG: carbon starvation protein A [bacterium]
MTVLIVLGAAVFYVVAYFTYGRWLARKVFRIDPARVTPANELRDDNDYLPTRRGILFGHHYTSIAGTGPIVGPAIAVIWGWLPALLWVLFGSVLMGAVHDFGALVVSTRNQGRSIADVAAGIIGRRAMLMLMILVFIALMIMLAVFVLVIANIFELYPQAVFPVWMQIPIAVGLGFLFYRRHAKPLLWTIAAVFLMYLTVVAGAWLPLQMPALLGISPLMIWLILLFVYAFVASILPVWTLLQPRDYINGYQLMVAMALLTLGVFIARPELVADAVQPAPAGAPPLLPILFITVACGAISGFHSLVASGTSSKQLANERDAQFIGYGSMLLEGFLAVLVLVAVGAGIGLGYQVIGEGGGIHVLAGREAFLHHYASWGAAQGLGAKVGAFVQGSANLLGALGIPANVAIALMGMFVVSFAGTSLDTAMRLQRYIVSELAAEYRIPVFHGRWSATLLATGSAALLALVPMRDPSGVLVFGKGGLLLWPLFGASNQLVAALALIVVTLYLELRRAPYLVTAIPAVLMVIITVWALALNLDDYLVTGRIHLFIIGAVLLLIEILMIVEGVKRFRTIRQEQVSGIVADSQ